MRISRRAWEVLAGTALIIVVLAASHAAWLTSLGSYLVAEQAPVRADMVVVLGGDLRGVRVLKGAELARAGYAPRVLVSGAGNMYGCHESDLAVAWAVAHGYDESLFVKLRYPAESTRDEARAITRELRLRHVGTFLLVTSTYHTRRAALVFSQEAPEMTFHVVGSPDPFFTPATWWKNREGEKIFVNEWSKTVANWLGV